MPNDQSIPLNQQPCTRLKGVGPQLALRLEKLGIYSIQDLIFHLPLRYQDRTHIIPLGRLRPGMQVAIEGMIELSELTFRGRTRFLVRLHDGTGFLTLRFFHITPYQRQMLSKGTRLRCFGEVRFGPAGYEMAHPEFKKISEDETGKVEETLTPIYPTTEGLHQLSLRKIIYQALDLLNENNLQDVLPHELLNDDSQKIPFLKDLVTYLHRPPPDANIQQLMDGTHPYQQRLAFEELLAHYLSLRELRKKAEKHQAISLHHHGKLSSQFIQQLPFHLTKAQLRVNHEIQNDLKQSHPMLRLVQGDVGSGKTIVAVLAALAAVENNYQAAVMAPTELLAEQHLKNFVQWLEPLGIKIAWLSGQLKGKARAQSLEAIKNGEANIIVGTHALFQEGVEFQHLALMIIDEQHRFGVHQRLALREKGFKNSCFPHQLIMTATPIPRTLAMSAYADLDHSIIDELPPGRTPVQTVVISNDRRAEVIQHIREACKEGRQVYWVCTLIEESEFLQCQAAEKTAEQLKEMLPELNISLVHGRMKSKEKESIMQEFKSGKRDLLVATTVIEVGVDVPNASLMVIENPERLGLAQLHQLRGRVGRGTVASHCVLLYQNPLSDIAKQRLNIMRESNDGFVIAQKDLELRGPGEVLGTKQTGLVEMHIADLIRDKDLLPKVHEAAAIMMQKYSDRIPFVIERWISRADEYGHV